MAVDPKDLSPVFFGKERPTHVGPIAVQQSPLAGRGLFTTRAVKAGECLFCTPPTVDADPRVVRDEWNEGDSVDEVAERVLVAAMRDALADSSASGPVWSFLALMGGGVACDETCTSIDQLLGRKDSNLPDVCLTDDELLQIVRQNAFGPDGLVTSARIGQEWSSGSNLLPTRILGLYPLAAMINHSCVANAIPVYVDGLMVVHARNDLPAGTELVWGYIPPTLPYNQRQKLLSERGFCCSCDRCREEENVVLSTQDVDRLEQEVLPSLASNQLRRYVRVSLAIPYREYLQSHDDIIPTLLQLHLAFCDVDNASLYHISLLQSAYRLTQSTKQAAFWVEQLKKAHQIRYGWLGHQLEHVRAALIHTQKLPNNNIDASLT